MNLHEYLKDRSGNAMRLAQAIGVNQSYLSQMMTGKRAISPIRCVKIEQFTGGLILREELRDDWREVWPELIHMRRKSLGRIEAKESPIVAAPVASVPVASVPVEMTVVAHDTSPVEPIVVPHDSSPVATPPLHQAETATEVPTFEKTGTE